MCIPLENSYIHRSKTIHIVVWHCVSLSKTVIFIFRYFCENEQAHCVSLSKTVIFINIMWDIVALELCIPLENSYIHQLKTSKLKQVHCVSLSKTVIFINYSRSCSSLFIVYPSRKQLYSSQLNKNKYITQLCIPLENSYIHQD